MALDFLNDNYVRVVFYFVAAIACIAAGLAEARRGGRGQWPWVWAVVAAAVLFFGLGRELQLGGVVTGHARDFAHSQGWYEQRRPLQRLADVAVLFAGLVAITVLAFFSWRNWRGHTSAVLVLVLMAVFITVRAISYHDTDQFLYGARWNGAELNAAIEAALTLLLTLTAIVSLAWPARGRRSPR